jgi:hypothetical protein
MIAARFRPLRWEGPSTPASQRRSRSTFKASWSDTLDRLDYELTSLRAVDIVIEAGFREQDIRLDGWPRAGAPTPTHPGVRVAFGSKHGPLVYATDSCELWQHNVRSIALGLEALRSVDRYGITRRAEQYTGWKAIEARPAPAAMDEDRAFEVIARHAEARAAGLRDMDAPLRAIAVRRAQRRTHPDRGGNAREFHDVQAAADVLRERGWLS